MSSKKPFLSAYGHVTIDQIISVDHFPGLNESVDVISKKTSLGGTGANIAICAAKLGVPTALCAFVGMDFPGKYLKDIEDTGLITDEFVAVEEYETSTCVILNNAQLEQKVIFYQGPQGYASNLGRDLLSNASQSEFVHICTGEPKYYLHLMESLRGKGPSISLDPAQETYRLWPESLLRKGVDLSDNLFCNAFEAKVIEERLGLSSVLDVGKSLVVKTDGAEGSIARIGDEIVHIPCIPCESAVDATGCGDAYRAGFYAGLYHGYDVRDSLMIASSVASFVIEKVGALTNVPTWEMAEERAKPFLK
ncbi:MAG: carbohydrate kinase family protein [archaeon]|nr:carbohydrate kinase family protein [archaeon]